MVNQVVIPVAGLGTRLLSATKEQPKEMLPVFSLGKDGTLCLKPMVELIFEQLFNFGAREFYFVVGRGKRTIQDHFMPDRGFVRRLGANGKGSQAMQLESFYMMIESSHIVWVNQPEPKGFGDAVLQVESLVGQEPFLVHAGDTYIISEKQGIVTRLARAHAEGKVEATLTIKEVPDARQYGVVEVLNPQEDTVRVMNAVEKPDHPITRLAIMPLYVFNSDIFKALRGTGPGKGGEIQLTDAIQRLISDGCNVQAVKLQSSDIRLDIGTPETYWEALQTTYRLTRQGYAV